MFLHWRTGPTRKPVDERDTKFPNVYSTANVIKSPVNSINVPLNRTSLILNQKSKRVLREYDEGEDEADAKTDAEPVHALFLGQTQRLAGLYQTVNT